MSKDASLSMISTLLRLGKAPVFRVPASKVRVISTPGQFYEELRHGIASSKERVVMASLYLGTDGMEQRLVADIDEMLKARPSLKAHFLLDALRGSRGGKSTSRSMIAPLVSRYGSRAAASFYHTPDLSGLTHKIMPPRWNETIGLQHMKIYLFDDTLILSGANLSELYFQQRQDRYVAFDGQKELADYFSSLVDTVSKFSFQLDGAGSLALPHGSPDPITQPARFRSEAGASLRTLLDQESSRRPLPDLNAPSGTDDEAYVMPLVQARPLNVQQDEHATLALLRALNRDLSAGSTHIACGYFNFTDAYEKLILGANSPVRILTASPGANGFYKSAGASGLIPDAYTFIERNFLKAVNAVGAADRLSVHEYARPKWTFHAKGMWFAPSADADPIMTMIGSPNYGSRSVYRDVEAQAMICTRSPQLRKELALERDGLFDQSQRVTVDDISQGERASSLFVRYVTPIIQRYF